MNNLCRLTRLLRRNCYIIFYRRWTGNGKYSRRCATSNDSYSHRRTTWEDCGSSRLASPIMGRMTRTRITDFDLPLYIYMTICDINSPTVEKRKTSSMCSNIPSASAISVSPRRDRCWQNRPHGWTRPSRWRSEFVVLASPFLGAGGTAPSQLRHLNLKRHRNSFCPTATSFPSTLAPTASWVTDSFPQRRSQLPCPRPPRPRAFSFVPAPRPT